MRDKLAIAAILALAAIVRFYRVDLTWFFLDQVRDVSVAAGIATGASFPLLGPRIGWTEAYLGPLYFYVLAVPFSISRDPVAGIVFVAAFHLAAVLALYRFAREFFGPGVALYASAFFAVFPLTAFSSRLVWHAGLLPPLVVLYMHALYRLIIRGQSTAVIALLALLAVLTQFHLASIALGGVALVAVVAFRPKLRIVHALVGMAVFLVLYLPYVVYEMAHGFENVRGLLGFAASEQGGNGLRGLASVSVNLLFLFLPALGGFIVEGEWSRAFLGGFRLLYASEAFLFALGLAICVSRLLTRWRRDTVDEVVQRRQAVLLLLWVSVPILMLGTKRTAIWWYYLDSVYPGPFILAGIALTSLPSLIFRGAPRQKRLAPALACLAAAIVASQVYFQVHFQRQSAERGALVVLVPRLSINAAGSPFETLITLPLGYRREIVGTLVRDFGVKDEAFFRKVHGAVLGLAEENRYLVDYLSTRRDGRADSVPTPDAHYLVAKADKGNSRLAAGRSKRIGPYAIYEYRPLVDYEGWSCSVTPGSPAHPARWTRLSVPASDLVLALREGERLFCRGTVHVPPQAGDVKVAVSLVGWAPFAARLHIDGRQLSPVAREGRQDPLMLKAAAGWSMGIGWASETVFDLTGSVQSGDNVVTIELMGTGSLISFDVYEGRSW
jgi:4-amino-4-deoxy-L-arabinose transferase-like glycosyltransferase